MSTPVAGQGIASAHWAEALFALMLLAFVAGACVLLKPWIRKEG